MKLIDRRYALSISVLCRSGRGVGWYYLDDPGNLNPDWWDEELWSRRN